jgi:hypothetical protein
MARCACASIVYGFRAPRLRDARLHPLAHARLLPIYRPLSAFPRPLCCYLASRFGLNLCDRIARGTGCGDAGGRCGR